MVNLVLSKARIENDRKALEFFINAKNAKHVEYLKKQYAANASGELIFDINEAKKCMMIQQKTNKLNMLKICKSRMMQMQVEN